MHLNRFSRADCFIPLSPALKFGDSHQETSTDADDAQIGQDVPFEMIPAYAEGDRRFIDCQRDAGYRLLQKERIRRRFLAGNAHGDGFSAEARARPPVLALEPLQSAVPRIHSCRTRASARSPGSDVERRLICEAYLRCDEPVFPALSGRGHAVAWEAVGPPAGIG